MTSFLYLFFVMAAGHAVGDYALQPPHMSRAKRGLDPCVDWPVALGYHSLIHGGAVALAAALAAPFGLALLLGLAELAAHGLADFAKSRRWVGPVADQLLHLGAKALWAAVAVFGAGAAG